MAIRKNGYAAYCFFLCVHRFARTRVRRAALREVAYRVRLREYFLFPEIFKQIYFVRWFRTMRASAAADRRNRRCMNAGVRKVNMP